MTRAVVTGRARRRPLTRLVPIVAVPGLIAIAVGVLLGPLDGGFPASTWYSAALFVLVLAAVVVTAAPPGPGERSHRFELALIAFGAFCAWSFASIAWAGNKGDAWDGANRTLLYGLVLGVVGLRPWRHRAATAALGLVTFGVAGIAAGTLLVSALKDNPASLFIDGRLSDPAGYANATADLWLIAFWPALGLATSRALPTAGRALAAGCATLLVETALLSQSRGALFGFVAAGVVYLALHPRRAVTLASGAGIAVLVAASWSPIVDVRDAPRGSAIGSALADARLAILLSFVAAVAVALAAIAAGRRDDVRALLGGAAARRAGRYLVAGVAAAGVVAAAIAIGNPASWASNRWDDFKSSGYTKLESGQTRFTGSLGSSRYDFYRVSLHEFANHPLQGIGADNFGEAYVRHRRSLESPRYPHSIAFRVLSQLGAVGTVLFIAFLALSWRTATLARRRLQPLDRALAVAALAGFVTWLMHGMFDWLWEFPALGILGMGLLAVAMRIEPDAPEDPDRTAMQAFDSPYEDRAALERSLRAWPERAVLGIAGIAAAASFALPGIAARYTSGAYHDFRTDPARTLARLERASQLNFLSSDPLVAKGVVGMQLGLPGVARDALRRAIDRDPGNWYAHFELALVDAGSGRPAEAQAELARARELNPRQPLISEVAAQVARSQPIDPEAVQAQLYAQLRERLGPTQGTQPDRP